MDEISAAEAMDRWIASQNYEEIRILINLLSNLVTDSSSRTSYRYYIIANGYAALASLSSNAWRNESLGRAVEYFKKSKYEIGFTELSSDIQSRVFANLGGELCRQGRILEGIQFINKALVFFENPVARLMKARQLLHFSQLLYDESHAVYFQKEAYPHLKYTMEMRHEILDSDHASKLEHDQTIVSFLEFYDHIFDEICIDYPHLSLINGKRAKSKKEDAYINWCLSEQLYVNDLNDISAERVVAFDVISLPGVTHAINPLLTTSETLSLNSAFSEIKYQYCSSRFSFFEAITSRNSKYETHHYSDDDLHLTSSLDYCLFRRDIEQIKIVFKSLYSCFDKMAVLMSTYLRHENSQKAHFSNVWFTKNDNGRKIKLRPEFESLDNPMLLALHWVSREITEEETEGHDFWMDSNAKRLSDIRNKMEHGGFRVVSGDLYSISRKFDADAADGKASSLKARLESNRELFESEKDQVIRDRLAADIERDENYLAEKELLKGYPLIITDAELREQTLRLMKKVRYAVIYLALAIAYQEKRREHGGIVMPLEVPTY